MRPAAPHSEELNRIERMGLAFLRGRSNTEHSAVRAWPAGVLEQIRGVERRTLVHAGVCGAVSGAIIGGSELALQAGFGVGRGGAGLVEHWPFWAAYLGVALVVSAAEIAYLYWRVLLAVARMGELSGLQLGPEDAEKMMALGLSRAALDIPNPRAPIHGVDPYARVPRWKLVLHAVMYRVKVSATSVVVRLLLRRLLGRAAVRSVLPFAAIAVYAVWNVVVTRWILAKARNRVAGPVAMRDLDELIAAPVRSMDGESRQLIAQAVAESITRSQDAHPNYVLFLDQLLDRLDVDADAIEQDWPAWSERVAGLDADARTVLLRVAVAVTILNGRSRKAQRELLAQLARSCGHDVDEDALRSLRQEFSDGKGLARKSLDDVFSSRATSARRTARSG